MRLIHDLKNSRFMASTRLVAVLVLAYAGSFAAAVLACHLLTHLR